MHWAGCEICWVSSEDVSETSDAPLPLAGEWEG